MSDLSTTEKQRVAHLLKQMQAKLDRAETRTREPVAVIGIGCRLPGGEGGNIEGAESFWNRLESGLDAIIDVPGDRWDADAWYDPDPDSVGKMNSRRGGFLADVDRFDAEFFGISPREAIAMDPQQRIVLEVAWQALEQAGIAPDRLAGSATGVYLGICTGDYARIGDGPADARTLDTYSGTGGAQGVAAGRLSYSLGLTGPSLVVDTACSSSLVATHLAVQALRLGECRMALAGGVNLVLLPDGTVSLSRLHMMAPDGHCKPFDAAADGFVRGEGCGILVLKRLADAQEDGDPVLAIITGSAVNQDGRSAGLTAPSGLAQEAVIRAALANAGRTPADLAYVEAHGTGTALGDPIEMNALAALAPAGRDRPLLVGSVKSNLGHLEAAAGVAGLIKAIGVLRRGRVPPTRHFRTLNPHIQPGGCFVAATALDLPQEGVRLAGVSSFGFSGTNAHILIEPPPVVPATAPRSGPFILPLSARRPAALAALRDALVVTPHLDADVAANLALGRARFDHRLAIVADDGDSARAALSAATIPDLAPLKPRIALLFSGQGAQYAGMGRALLAREPIFRQSILASAAVLDPVLGRSLVDLLTDTMADIDQTGWAQPALLAYALALFDLLTGWGVAPVAVMGHSLGEYAAAIAAGMVDRDDALRLVAKRGALMQALPTGGAMAAVMAGAARVTPVLARHPSLSLAADNGPAMVTIAGPADAVAAACAELSDSGIESRALPVSHAFHSGLLDPMLDGLEQAASGVTWRPAQIPLIGNLTGGLVTHVDARYWRRHSREPVAFAAGLATLAGLSVDLLVEVGPRPVLLPLTRTLFPIIPRLPLGRQGDGEGRALAELLATLWNAGADIDWRAVQGPGPRRVADLPTYPFQRRRFWRDGAGAHPPHPLLGDRIDLPDGATLFRRKMEAPRAGYLGQHVVAGQPILSAASLLELSCHALARVGRETALSEISFAAPVSLAQPLEMLVELRNGVITVQSRALHGGEGWTRHLTASGAAPLANAAPPDIGRSGDLAPADLYEWLGAGGIDLTGAFRLVDAITRTGTAARVAIGALPAGSHLLHPCVLDAAFQALAAITATPGQPSGALRIPAGIDHFQLSVAAPGPLRAEARLRDGMVADISLIDSAGALVAQACGFRLSGQQVDDWRRWLLRRDWVALPGSLTDIAATIRNDLDHAGLALADLHGLGVEMDRVAGAFAAAAMDQVLATEVASSQHALYDRLRAQAPAPGNAPTLIAGLVARYPGNIGEIDLLARCGAALPQILRGEVDPLTLLFPADGGGAAGLYRDSPVSRVLNSATHRAVLDSLPGTGHLRILEVGSGTGGTTDGLIPLLPADRMADYCITDIAPSLLADAGRRHAAVPWVHTARFDAEHDPAEQGIHGPYHVILAANVLHATADLGASLRHLCGLLAPGGTLVLLEGVGAQGWVDLVFGLTPGWWRFTDRAARPDYPMPDARGWNSILTDAGFTPVLVQGQADALSRQALILARRTAQARRWGLVGEGAADLAEYMGGGTDIDAADAVVCLARLTGDDPAAELQPVRQLALSLAARGVPLTLVTSGVWGGDWRQAPLWGLGRALAAEYPDLHLRLIDRDNGIVSSLLADAIGQELGEDQIRLTASGPLVPRLRPLAATGDDRVALDPDARYLITGGLGGLGLRTARWMVDRGARQIILLGRRAPDAAVQAILQAMEAQIHVVIGDVADADTIGQAIATGTGRLAGIVHAAGTLRDAPLSDQNADHMRPVLDAKVTALVHLRALAGPVDFLILYSSAVGLVGSRGQANHMAANAALDALAHGEDRPGERVISLAWGAWRDIGSAAGPDLAARLRQGGMRTIDPDQGVRVLDWALTVGPGFAGVLPREDGAFADAVRRAGKVPPVLADLVPDIPVVHAAASVPIPPFAPLLGLADQVRALAADVLAADGPDAIDPRRNLFDLGLDSLMAVELRNRLTDLLGRRLSAPLPSTLLFDHSSVEALVTCLQDLLAPEVAPPPSIAMSRRAAADAVAIIGLDCRFPGGADGPDAFWRHLLAGFDAVGTFPPDRWDPGDTARMTTRWGAFLEGVDRFDAGLFRIAPREAVSMDPQQRLWLECAWNALESAGQPPDRLSGTSTGVYVGLCNYDYAQIASGGGRIDAWSGTGGAPSIVAGRLSYVLGLEGPAMVVDTACSSGLVAVHLAARAVADGECRMAIAGAVNLILAPSSTVALSELQMMAPDGRCKAFDDRADGFVRGEGVAAIVVKRLSDALTDGDPVLAIIRGSALNQDGRSSSLTAPSGRAQEAVIRSALARSALTPGDIGYVEAHGTGTALGDPIEIHALKSVFAAGRIAPLAVGAVKTNVGHLESAAGMAGLVKAVLALRHGLIPPNNHLRRLNQHIDIDGFDLLLPIAPTTWPPVPGPRRAGVSAFGFSGTNAHIVLEQAPDRASAASSLAFCLFLASGATAEAARTRAADLADLLADPAGPAMGDLSHTTLAGRAQLGFRIAVTARDGDRAGAIVALRAADPVPPPALPPRIGFAGLDAVVAARWRTFGLRPVAEGEVADIRLDHVPFDPQGEMELLARLFLAGINLDGRAITAGHGRHIVATAPYPFERQRYWVDPVTPAESAAHTALLAVRQRGPGAGQRFQTLAGADSPPWLADHGVRGVATLPAAGMLVLLAQASGGGVADARFHRLLSLDKRQVILTDIAGDHLTMLASAEDADDWQPLADAVSASAIAPPAAPPLEILRARITRAVDIDGFYKAFADQGLGYGLAFRPVTALWAGSGEALARLDLLSSLSPAGMDLHPTLLDGAFQCLGAAADGVATGDGGYLPVALDRFGIARPAGRQLWAWLRLTALPNGDLSGDVSLFGPDGTLVAWVEGLCLRPNVRPVDIDPPVLAARFDLDWRPATVGRDLPLCTHLTSPDPALADALRRADIALVARDDAEQVLARVPDGLSPLDAALWMHGLVRSLIDQHRPPRLVLLATEGDIASAALSGYVRTLALEHPDMEPAFLALSAATTPDEIVTALTLREDRLRHGSDGWQALHLVESARHPAAQSLVRGAGLSLDELADQPLTLPPLSGGKVRVRVAASGLNFRDVMNALGTYPGDGGTLGGECAGRVVALGAGVSGLSIGQRVMAVAPDALGSMVDADAALVLPVPSGWTMELAATIPTVFLTAAHALRQVGHVAVGQNVLIHAGTGGLGLAAIQIARAAGATVLATAGSAEKRDYLRGMGVDIVGGSRSPAFRQTVIDAIGPRSVDIVLNALSGPMIDAGFDLLRPGGRFLEVGKAGIWTAEQAASYRPDVEYHAIALDADIVTDPARVGALWRGLMDEFAAGTLAPLPVTVFDRADPVPAFRHMQQARHIGRIALSRRRFRGDATYLVTGGSGAVGRHLARWLAEGGAGRILLASRTPATADSLIDFERTGAMIEPVALDMADDAAVAALIVRLADTLAGVIHAAGSLDDGVITQLSPDRFAPLLAAKLGGAMALDRATRGLDLDFFILISSASGLVGSAGQANYAVANAGLDALAQARRASGHHALSVDWGAWQGGGMAGHRAGPALAPDAALAALDDLLRRDVTQAMVLPMSSEKVPKAEATAAAGWAVLLNAIDPAQRPAHLHGLIRAQVATILNLPAESLGDTRPLNDYGLDSLMAVELRNALAAASALTLPASLIFDYPTLSSLSAHLADRLGLSNLPLPVEAPADDGLNGMSEDELALALMTEMDRAGY